MITWTVLFKKMEEKTDRIKKESQDKIRKFKSKGIFSLNNVIVKKNGNVKTKHYLTPKKQQKETSNDLQNIKVFSSNAFLQVNV